VDIDCNITVDLKTDAVYNAVREALDAKDARIAELEEEAALYYKVMLSAESRGIQKGKQEMQEQIQEAYTQRQYALEALQTTMNDLVKAEAEVQELSDIIEAYDMYSIEFEKTNADLKQAKAKLEDSVKYLHSLVACKNTALAKAEEENRQLTKELTKTYNELAINRSALADYGIKLHFNKQE
jgi:chromosome segregation ATPase